MAQSSVHLKGDVVVISPAGELTRPHYPMDLTQHVASYLGRNFRHFVIDFSKVTAIDSPGLGIIFSLCKRVMQENGTLTGCSIPDRLRLVFEVMSLSSIIRTYETLEDALELTVVD